MTRSTDRVFLKLGTVYAPKATSDIEKAKEWMESDDGRVVLVDETIDAENVTLGYLTDDE